MNAFFEVKESKNMLRFTSLELHNLVFSIITENFRKKLCFKDQMVEKFVWMLIVPLVDENQENTDFN